jgi:hypothetical protein
MLALKGLRLAKVALDLQKVKTLCRLLNLSLGMILVKQVQ